MGVNFLAVLSSYNNLLKINLTTVIKNLLAQALSKKIIMKDGMNRFLQRISFYEGIRIIKLLMVVGIEVAKRVFISTHEYSLIPINLSESSRQKHSKFTEILTFEN